MASAHDLDHAVDKAVTCNDRDIMSPLECLLPTKDSSSRPSVRIAFWLEWPKRTAKSRPAPGRSGHNY